jgi:hypothetical protein
MRILLLVLVFVGLIAAAILPDKFRKPSDPAPAPHYVNGQPVLNDPNPPADADHGPEERAARAAHRTALDHVYSAFDHPWSAMCALEQRIALVKALNAYYGERLRFERKGAWLRPDEWKGTAFDWKTFDDTRIEFLTRVSFSNRYFVINELEPGVAEIVSEVVRGQPSRQHFCHEEYTPWNTGIEGYRQHDRESTRANALAQLKARWVRSCEPGTRRGVVRDLSDYYQVRVTQQTNLIEWGTPGLRRARDLWGTEEDQTIDDLTRSMLRDGYLSLDDIRQNGRPLVASLIDGAAGTPRCPEKTAKAK